MDFQELSRRFDKFLDVVPRKIAVIAVQHFEESFRLGGYNEEPFQKWTNRKNPKNRRNIGRAVMIKTNTLGRSLRVKSASMKAIVIGTDVPYAQIHNEGGTIKHPGGTPYVNFNSIYTARKKKGRIGSFGDNQMTFLRKDGNYPAGTKFTKPHDITIPKRQFIGDDNRKLRRIIEQVLEDEFLKILKQ
jgi:phage gpG-like protein